MLSTFRTIEIDNYFLFIYVLLEHREAAAFAYQGVSYDFFLSEGFVLVLIETLHYGEVFRDDRARWFILYYFQIFFDDVVVFLGTFGFFFREF